MQTIRNSEDLGRAIQSLENEHHQKLVLLKKQFYITYESLKPVNLLVSTITDISSSPNLLNNVVATVTGLATGYLSKKVFIGTSGNVIKKAIGAVLQYGITNIIAKHPETVRAIGQFFLQRVFRKKNNESEL